MILLASKSPRRRELLKLLDLQFEIVEIKNIEEVFPADLPKEKVPEYLSKLKAAAYIPELKESEILITADTIVLLDGEIIGKPGNLDEAVAMLKKLSGRTHKVITGVNIATIEKNVSFSTDTDVSFAELTEAQIRRYVEEYRPLDKAGAYGIQEWIGAVGVEGIYGSFYNVMGLPIHRLYRELTNSFGI